MKIEHATKSYIDQILVLIGDTSTWLREKGIHQWRDPYPEAVLEGEIERGEVFVDRVGNEVIGMLTLNQEAGDFWKKYPAEAIYLHRLVVKRSFAGKQRGRSLVAWAVEEVRSRATPTLRLDCDANNVVLRRFYEGLGFVFIAVEHHETYNMDFALYEKRV